MIYTYIPSPVGDLLAVRGERNSLTASPGALTGLYLPTGRHAAVKQADWQRDDDAFDDLGGQFAEYFAGERRTFDVPLNATGTAFQQQVWAALRDIPYGETRSYSMTALAIGAPTAARAVGMANGRNPISIIVPCHRVVGADGSLTGYGGGLDAKRWLLAHERERVGLFAGLS